MTAGGAALRFGSLTLRFLQLCCAAIGLGIFSYFLATLSKNNLPIANRWRAVEGLTGAATLYTLLAVLGTLFLGGNAFFGYLAAFLDVLFIGAFIVVAWFTRRGANSCTGTVSTPLGVGPANRNAPGYGSNNFGFGSSQSSSASYFPNLRSACRLNTAVFSVAIIAIFLFLLTVIWQILMVRHHKKEKRYGPSPSNGYTSGTGKVPFWKRNRKVRHTRDTEAVAVVPTVMTTTTYPTAVRPSHETGTTIGNNQFASEPKYGEPGYGQTGHTYRNTDPNAIPYGAATVHDRTTY